MSILKPELTLRLNRGEDKYINEGCPWVYNNQISTTSELELSEPGILVDIVNHQGRWVALGYYNPHSNISCRVLSNSNKYLDYNFFFHLLNKANVRRIKEISVPYYRLIHSESDGLPGLIIDRFDNIFVIQIGTAGMERLKDFILDSLDKIFEVKTIIMRNDFPARKSEGLETGVEVIRGKVSGLTKVFENNCWYYADLINGQKTGWFYDQRDNRKLVADYADGKTVLDVYSYVGGFGILCALRIAKEVTLVDSSESALEIAKKSAALNKVNVKTIHGKAYEVMENLYNEGINFDVVVADPPAFIKHKKYQAQGIKGYEKVAKLASQLVKNGGIFHTATCSHNATRKLFNNAVYSGIRKASKNYKLIKETGAASDHPIHPKLPQSEYLKAATLRITDIVN